MKVRLFHVALLITVVVLALAVPAFAAKPTPPPPPKPDHFAGAVYWNAQDSTLSQLSFTGYSVTRQDVGWYTVTFDPGTFDCAIENIVAQVHVQPYDLAYGQIREPNAFITNICSESKFTVTFTDVATGVRSTFDPPVWTFQVIASPWTQPPPP